MHTPRYVLADIRRRSHLFPARRREFSCGARRYITSDSSGDSEPFELPPTFVEAEPSKIPSRMDGLKPEVLATFVSPKDYVPSANADFSDVSNVASYNWTAHRDPTIVVPGLPHVYRPPPTPFTLDARPEKTFLDRNLDKLPWTPLLPIFLAADILKSPVDWPNVDVITDQGNLRKLLNWLRKTRTPFSEGRIDFQLAGSDNDTMLLERWLPYTYNRKIENELLYGAALERATAKTPRLNTWIERSRGYSSVIKYNMGGLNVIVRSEVDAYIPEHDEPQSSTKTPTSDPDPEPTYEYGVRVIRAGTPIPPDRFIELKSRVAGADPYMTESAYLNDRFPQLLFSQTPVLHVARRRRGVIEKIEVHPHDGPSFSRAKRRTQWAVGELVKLLSGVRDVARDYVRRREDDQVRFSLVRAKGDEEFKLYEQSKRRRILPEAILQRFGPPPFRGPPPPPPPLPPPGGRVAANPATLRVLEAMLRNEPGLEQ